MAENIASAKKGSFLQRFLNISAIIATASAVMLSFSSCAGKDEAPEEGAEGEETSVSEEVEVTEISVKMTPKSKEDFFKNSDNPAVQAAVSAKEESIADRPAYITIKGVEFSTDITSLTLNAKELTDEDIADLRYMINLRELQIYENNITDLSPLTGLTELTSLSVFKNNVSDLTPLKGLVNLQTLYLRSNDISDITPLAGLTDITNLDLSDNHISDISALSGMKSMRLLKLNDNEIEDISPLGNMSFIDRIHIQNNRISDINPLWRMTETTEIYAENNNISDISVVSEMKNLGWLKLSGNPIEDLSPVYELTGLKKLWITDTGASTEGLAEALPDCNITY